jgi:alginate O-acetyltransferase complex protein AlgI
VFFRAPDLPSAGRYLLSMAGLGEPQPGAVLVDGILRQPYYLLCFALAAAFTWLGRDVWEWTRVLDWRTAAASVGILWLALIAMATQGYNPFIYFIF